MEGGGDSVDDNDNGYRRYARTPLFNWRERPRLPAGRPAVPDRVECVRATTVVDGARRATTRPRHRRRCREMSNPPIPVGDDERVFPQKKNWSWGRGATKDCCFCAFIDFAFFPNIFKQLQMGEGWYGVGERLYGGGATVAARKLKKKV